VRLQDALNQQQTGVNVNGKENMAVVLYVVALIAVVVGVDILFFRHRFWQRLMVNIGIVLVFGAFYLRFLKHP
jgi:type IV secretory pathway VirB2 component (pilin)